MNVTIASDRLVLDAGSYITTIMGSDILDVRAEQVKNGQKVDFRVRIVRRAGTDVYIDLTTQNPPYRAWQNNMGGAAQCVADISAIAGVAPVGSTIIVIGGTEVSNFLWTTAALNLTNASMTLASNALSLSVHAPQTGFTTATTTGTNVVGTLGTNGLSMGIPAYITTGGGGGAITISAGTLSGSRDSLVFSNANGVSFGMNGSTITGSVQTNYAPSNVTSGRAGTGVTTATTAGSVLVATLNTNGLSAGVPAWLTTAQPPGAYLTTAMPSNAGSNFVQATATIAGTNVSGTIASNVISLSVAAPVAPGVSFRDGVGGALMTDLQFVNSNGVSWNLDTALSQIKASVQTNYLTTAAPSNISTQFVQAGAGFAGTNAIGTIASNGISVSVAPAGVRFADSLITSQMTALEFRDGPGVTWTLDTLNNRVGASVQTNYLTTQSNQAFSASGGSSTFQTLNFANSNGLTFSNSNGSVIASYTVPSTAGLLSAVRISGGTDTYDSSQLNFRDGGGVSWTADTNGSILASVQTSYAGQGFTSATTAGTAVVGTLGTNGLSMGIPAYLTTAAQSNHSHGNPTLALTNLLGTTASNSAGFTLSLSAAAPGGGGGAAISGGTNSQSTGTVNFSNSNGVSFGLNTNGVMTASVAGDNTATQNTFENRQLGASSALAHGQNTLWLAPFRLDNALNASTLMHMFSFTGSGSSSNSGQVGVTMRFALFQQTATASTDRFDSIWSKSIVMTGYLSSSNSMGFTAGGDGQATTISGTNTTLFTNIWNVRMLTVPIASTIDPGRYLFGFVVSTSSAGNSAALRTIAPIVDRPMTVNLGNNWGAAIGASVGYMDAGVYSATTGAIPASVDITQFSVSSNVSPFFKIGAL